LKAYLNTNKNFYYLSKLTRSLEINTICTSARCPNIYECWGSKTATFMILGDTCTRNCRFCNVKKGNPGGFIDKDEIDRLLDAIKKLKLRYVVITSVDRDDLPDGGASHFANVINAIKEEFSEVIVEVLTPDFGGSHESIIKILDAKPHVYGHNIETVARLTPIVRDRRASYSQSLNVLKFVKKYNSKILTKSSILLGLGETEKEVIQTMRDLHDAQVDILTIGQYLQPTRKHYPVKEYIHPEIFKYYEDIGYKMGFGVVVSGPLVRSSYRAAEYYIKQVVSGLQ
jgi:lipoic acid synthetase